MRWKDPHLWWALLAAQLPALAPAFKYAPESLQPWVIPALGILCVCLAWTWSRRGELLSGLLESRGLFLAFLILFTLVIGLTYPEADGLKTAGLGSDADDAIIQGVTRLFSGQSPYAEPTYSGHPISAGPGWLLLWSPLVWLNLFWLAGPLSVAALGLSLRRASGTWTSTNVALVLLASSLATWEGLVTGTDHLMIGALVAALTLELCGRERTRGQILTLGVLLGLVATSRVVFLYIPVVVAVALWPRDRKTAVVAGGVSMGVALALHGAFYLLDPANYTPVHVLTMGEEYTSSWVRWSGMAGCVATGLWLLMQLRDGGTEIQACLCRLWPTMAAPLAVIALGGLELVGWRPSGWWTVRFLIAVTPMMVATWAVARRPLSRETIAS